MDGVRPMVWIGLEGTDGVGKSTLAEAVRDLLERKFGSATLIHHGPPEKSVLEEYATDLEGREGENIVLDRHHMGTLVYAPLYRDTGPWGELGVAGFRWVEKFLEARGTSFFVVDLPYDVVKRRLETRGEDYLQSHHVEGVLERFREVNGLSILTPGSVFTPSQELRHVPGMAELIVEHALRHASGYDALRAFPSYVGGLHPDVLLVGEKRGGRPPFESAACFMPVKNRSGAYFWEALPDPYWRRVGVVNAREDDSVLDLWNLLDNPSVVALGREASRALTKLAIPHAGAPHPQAIKRFHSRQQQDYGRFIADITGTKEQRFQWPN
jgi:thymidylate kinase